MKNRTWYRVTRHALLGLGIAAVTLAGCNDNGTGGASGRGSMVLIMHDAPVDDFKEVWVTVESVTMIGADADSNASGEVVLSESVRMDLLTLDSTAQIIAAADVAAGSYSKIRLQVSDPEFVRNDDSVFMDEDILLVANGHVDINTQGDVFVVGEQVTVVSLDLDVNNSIQINQTGNGRYILRPQIFVDNDMADEEGIVIRGATVTSINLSTGRLTLSTSQNVAAVDLMVSTTSETDILSVGGLPVGLVALSVGSTVDVVGTIDVDTGVVTASEIRVML